MALAAGCGQANPSVVAYVGGTEISQRQLDAAVIGIQETVPDGQQVSAEAVVNVMIQGELSAQIAAERKIAISDADRNALVRTTNLAPLLDFPEAKLVAYDFADQNIVSSQLGAEAYLAELAKREVTLNPRYGVLDPQQKIILEGQSGSLSTPAPGAPVPSP
jgi:hypothetical protein